MNKTVTINISGIIFHIEEDAYNKLRSYLNAIQDCFKNSDGRDEIMSDIESRIAEMLQENVSATKQVVLMTDVDHVISVMGQPEQFAPESEPSGNVREKADPTSSEKTEAKKRVYRNPDDKILGGVCSGISVYFGIDPIWLRLAFPIVFFVWGSGLLVYILLWIIIPKAVTSAQKLEMRGEPVNIDNIKKTVEEEATQLKSRLKDFENEIKDFDSKKAESGFSEFVKKTGGLFESLFTGIFRVIARIIGFVLILVSLPLLIVTIFVFSAAPVVTILAIGLILLIGIPLLSLVYAGFKLLLQIKRTNRFFNFLLIGLWFLGIALSAIYGYKLANSFSIKEKSTNNIILQQPKFNTLYISSKGSDELQNDNHIHSFIFNNGEWKGSFVTNSFFVINNDEKTIIGYPKFDIIPSENDSFSLELIKSARGGTSKEALIRSEKINYEFSQTDSLIELNEYFDMDKTEEWKNQQVRIVLKVPVNKEVYLNVTLDKMIYDIDNTNNTYDQDMLGHKWIMTKRGLTLSNSRETY